MNGRVGVEQTPDIEAMLSEHRGEWRGSAKTLSMMWVCTCGDHEADEYADHEAHVAQALAPVLAAAVREAEERAWREGAAAGHHSPLTWFALRQCNPYRADRIAVDAPEGGEGR